MLSRLILLAVQLAVAWFAAPEIMRYLPGMGDLRLFVYAAVFAVLVWVVGLIQSQVLRETGMPSSSTLVATLVMALIGAALIQFLPAFVPDLRGVMYRIPTLVYPLLGAVIGYHLKR
jgi:hypothetical protein